MSHDLTITSLTTGAGLVAGAKAAVIAGADIIEIAVSGEIAVQEELDQLTSAIAALIAAGITIPIAAATSRPLVADQAIEAGASIIRALEISPEMEQIVALHDARLIRP